MEQFLGPSTQFFRFNANDLNVLVTPIEKKTCLLTKRNVYSTAASAVESDEASGESTASSSTTRIRFTPATTNNGKNAASRSGVNTIITNTNRYQAEQPNRASATRSNHGLKSSNSSSSLLLKKNSNSLATKSDVFCDPSSASTSPLCSYESMYSIIFCIWFHSQSKKSSIWIGENFLKFEINIFYICYFIKIFVQFSNKFFFF